MAYLPLQARPSQRGRRRPPIDLEKLAWPWSLMLVSVLKPELFELANNHVWRTQFGFREWYAEMAPAYMQLDMPQGIFSEWGWIDFGLQTY